MSRDNFWTCGNILLSLVHWTLDPSCSVSKCNTHPTLKIKESPNVGAQDNACMIILLFVMKSIVLVSSCVFHSWNMNNFRDTTQFHAQFHNLLVCVSVSGEHLILTSIFIDPLFLIDHSHSHKSTNCKIRCENTCVYKQTVEILIRNFQLYMDSSYWSRQPRKTLFIPYILSY